MNHPVFVYTCPVGDQLRQCVYSKFNTFLVFIFERIVYSLYVKKMCFITNFFVLAVLSGKSLAPWFGILDQGLPSGVLVVFLWTFLNTFWMTIWDAVVVRLNSAVYNVRIDAEKWWCYFGNAIQGRFYLGRQDSGKYLLLSSLNDEKLY